MICTSAGALNPGNDRQGNAKWPQLSILAKPLREGIVCDPHRRKAKSGLMMPKRSSLSSATGYQ
jgi:hypothetical protein